MQINKYNYSILMYLVKQLINYILDYFHFLIFCISKYAMTIVHINITKKTI